MPTDSSQANHGTPHRSSFLRPHHWIAVALVAFAGIAVGLATQIRPVPKPTLVAMWLSKPLDREALHSPVLNDAVAMEESGVFKESEKLGERALVRSAKQFQEKLNAIRLYKSDEPLVVYVSGLADYDAGKLQLLIGSDLESRHVVRRSFQEVIDAVEACQSDEKLLVLDLNWPTSPVSIELDKIVSEMQSNNVVVFSSCSAGEYGQTIYTPRRSVFNLHFMQGLRGAADGSLGEENGRVTIAELARYLQDTVPRYTARTCRLQQNPQAYFAETGHARFELSACSEETVVNSVASKIGLGTQQESSALANNGEEMAKDAVAKANSELEEQKADNADTDPVETKAAAGDGAAYPPWLQEAWAVRDGLMGQVSPSYYQQPICELERQILAAEFAWHDGHDVSVHERGLKESIGVAEQQVAKVVGLFQSPAEKLAGTIQGQSGSNVPEEVSTEANGEPDGEWNDQQLFDCTKEYLLKLRSLSDLPVDARSEKRATLLSEFREKVQAADEQTRMATLFRYASQDLQFQLSDLPSLVEILPSSIVTMDYRPAMLRLLAEKFAAEPTFARTRLHVQSCCQMIEKHVSIGGQAPQTTLLQSLYRRCDDRRYVAETLFWNPEHVSNDEFEASLDAALESLEALQASQQRIRIGLETLVTGQHKLEQFQPILKITNSHIAGWNTAVDALNQLAAAILSSEASDGVLDERTVSARVRQVYAKSETAQGAMDVLFHGFSEEELERLVAISSDGAATQETLLRMQLVLGTAIPSSQLRPKLYLATSELSKRLGEATLSGGERANNHSRRTFRASNANSRGDVIVARAKPSWGTDDVIVRERIALRRWETLSEYFAKLAKDSPLSDQYLAAAGSYATASGSSSARRASKGTKAKREVLVSRKMAEGDVGYFVKSEAEADVSLKRVTQKPRAKESTVALLVEMSGVQRVLLQRDSLRLRALGTRSFADLYVRNQDSKARSFIVQLTANGSAVKQTIDVAAGATEPLIFAGKPTDAKEDLPTLVGDLEFEISDASTGMALAKYVVNVELEEPREYVEVVSARFSSFSMRRNLLEVWLRLKQPAAQIPCSAELKLASAKIPGLAGFEGGRLTAMLDPSGNPTKLYVENLDFEERLPELGTFAVKIDGYDRAFCLESNFDRQVRYSTPKLQTKPSLSLLAPQRALAGADFRAVIQVSNAPSQAGLTVTLGKDSSAAEPDVTVDLRQSRRTRFGFAATTGGSLEFQCLVEDQQVALDTSHLVGERRLEAAMVQAHQQLASASLLVALDDRPPSYVRFVDPPQRVAAESNVEFCVLAESMPTGIRLVELFQGRPTGDEPPKTAVLTRAARLGEDDEKWTCAIAAPKTLGKFEITARVTNGAGLRTLETIELEVVNELLLNVGAVTGTVFEGVIRQPKIEVQLLDPAGNVVARNRTNASGEFQFPNVLSGSYVVSAKKSSSGRSAAVELRIAKGKTEKLDLSLGL